MFFTREDILKIQQALLQLGVKDSELPSAEPVTYDDTLSIVQDGKNKQIKIEDFFNQISLWKREDFLNITDRYDEHYIMLLEAINLVPILQRKDGLVITFQDTNGDWRIYQFRGNITEFLNKEKWFDLYDYRNYIIKSFLPDEEDITALTPDENGNSFLALKDRIYDPAIFSSKGYKFVRKNIINIELATIKISVTNPTILEGDIYFKINNKGTKVHLSPTIHNTTKLVSEAIKDALVIAYNDYKVTVANSTVTLTRKYSGNTSPTTFEMYNTGVRVIVEDSTTISERNIITQEDINEENTIYEIRYDFDLDGKTIIIPNNCVLYFTSGKFYNGSINMDNTVISTLYEDVLLEVNINGSYYNIQEYIKNHQRQLDDKQSQIDDKQQQITANDEDILLLQTRSTQMEETIRSIAVTGGASQATAVTYNNDASRLNAINAQSAIDEVSSIIDELSDVISNITNFTNDGVLYLDGTIKTSQPGKFKHTGYLKIDSNYPIILKADTTNQYLSYICFYNADKKFISGLSNTEEKRTKKRIESGDIPEETRYIIVCDNVNNSDSFVSYHPFQEQTVNRFVDIPKGNNIYCPLYTSYNINSLKDTVIYSMPVFIKRNREYNTLTISKRDFGYFLHIYFYDIDNVLIKTVKDKSEGTIDIPSSCEYIGFSDFGKELRDGGKSMVNWGSEVMEYEPYDSFFMQSVINKEYFDKYTKNPGVQFAFKNEGLVDVNGNINTTQTPEYFRNTGYIKIDKNCPIIYLGDSANQYVNVISYYDADKKYISGLSNIDTKQATLHIIQPEDIPENTRYVICTARTIQVEKSDNSAFFLCTPFNNIDNSIKIVDIPVGKNIYNQNFNYLNTLTFSKTVKCPTIIKRDENYNQLTISKRVLNYFLFVVFLDIDFIEISRIIDKQEGATIDIPTNCQYIQFIDFVGELQGGRYTMVNWGSEIMEYEPYKSILSSNILSSKENFHKNRIYNKELSSLTTGSLVIDNVPNVMFNQTISLTARLGEIGKITLSHGKVLYAIGIVEIDDTNIYTYSALSHDPTLLETIPHGLTFNSFIQCIIRQNADATATIIIRTLGGEFKKDNIPFLGCRDDVMLEAENSNLTDIKLSYTCSDFSKDIWSFGDSYFGAIPAKLKELGYNNSLFDSYSGRNSVQAMQSLKKMIGIIGIPKIIYWAMGMNDADTEESVNTNWKNSLEELKAICSKYNVELVLSTIPNVPKINHTFKNEIVKNSGYKYVDINKAVGADISTNWYSGLISGDKVHPKTGTGDYVIAMAVINTIPELRNI